MNKVIKRFLQICLFQASPADIPASSVLVNISIVCYFMVGVLVSHIDHNWIISLVASLADTIMLIIVTKLLLVSRGLSHRFEQTVTAMASTGAIVGLVSWPVFSVFRLVEPHSQLTSIILLMVLIIIFWSLFVVAHIFRYALDIRPGLAAIITVAYVIVSLIVVGLTISGVT
ncbi:hypothetical protein [Methylophaga sp.]|uniref:hypothetical protein n=1 Tax=Methylophaga sp. TaxID=2024840 RepID=UPI003A941859